MTTVKESDLQATITIPAEEWRAHKEKVEVLCSLLNGLLGALSVNPMIRGMIPQDILRELETKTR